MVNKTWGGGWLGAGTSKFSLPYVRELAGLLLAAGLGFSCLAQPVNDNFTNRIFLTGESNVVTVSTVGATLEPGERHADAMYPTVWYSWTAPAAGTARVSDDGGYVRFFGVYTGTRLSALHQVDYRQDLVSFDTQPGQVFQIQAAAPPATSPFEMTLEFTPRPLNDNFADRIPLSGVVVSTNGSNAAATREPGEPRHNQRRFGRSVWYSWTAPASGWLLVNLSSADPMVCQDYIGSSVQRLRSAGGLGTSVTPFSGFLPVTEGVDYEFAVDGMLYYDRVVYAEPFTLSLEFSGLTLLRPATNILTLFGPTQVELAATNTLPDLDGALEALTFYASNVLTQQEMPVGTTSGPLFFDLLWTNPPEGYWLVQARGTNDQGRLVKSNPSFLILRPLNDNFNDRLELEDASGAQAVDFAAATRVATDPRVAKPLHDDFNGTTLWYSWTAPAEGTVTWSCDNVDIALAAYVGRPGAFRNVMEPCYTQGQFVARAGETYQILLSDRSPPTAPSQGTLSWSLQP